jgi:hypothetical protein
MEMYANKLCISYSELTNGIVSKPNVDAMVRRGQLQQVRRACYGNCALYVVESLPQKYRVEVYRRYPDAQEKADSKPFVESVEPDGAAMQFFAEYVLSDGRHLTADKQQEYSNNSAILNAFRLCIERANSHRIRQSKAKIKLCEFWAKAAAALPRLSDAWPNSLPQNARRLHQKFNEYQQQGYVCFISRKWQNKNAAKVADEEQERTLMAMLSHHNNLDNVMIAEYYNRVAETMGWETIAASTVGVWREKLDLVSSAGRRGVTNFRNEKTMQVTRRRPSAAFLMWSLDGWDAELLYQQTVEDKQGHRTTTYHNRLTVEVVLDPCCDYPIGYAIGTHETPELITAALRDAARHSQELTGQMLKAYQLQYDHYAIKAMTPLYEAISKLQTPAKVKNAKAKPVERYFGHLNNEYCKRCNNWSGYGITSDPKKQPNSEALNMLRHSFPDEAGVRQQIAAIIELERKRKHQQFMEFYAKLTADKVLPLSRESYLYHFGNTTGYTNALTGSGMHPTLLGVRRDYECFDLSFRKHAGEKWAIMYDPDDTQTVLAVNADGTLRYMLEQKYVQPMALADRKEGDAQQLERVRTFDKQLEDHVIAEQAATYKTIENMAQRHPELDILRRFCLLDSHGQHKLPKAQARLSAQDIEAIEVKPVAEVPLLPQGAAPADKDDYSIF